MNTQDENECHLTQQLRREARQSRPLFSDALHSRLLAAISAADADGIAAAVAHGRRHLYRQLLSWTLTTTAAIAMTLTLALLLSNTRLSRHDAMVENASGAHDTGSSRNPGIATQQDSAVNIAADDFDTATANLVVSASGVSDWVVSAANQSRWVGLDRDAQAALAAVAGPLPFDLTFSVAQNSAP